MAPAMPARSVVPGPRPTPLLGWRGNAIAFYRDPLGHVLRLHDTYGEVAALAYADPAFVFAFGPDPQRQLLDQPLLFASALQLSSAAEPPTDLPQQIPAEALDRYGTVIGALTEQVLDRWGAGRLVDVAYVMQQLTLRIAALALLGQTQPPEVAQTASTLQRWGDHLFAPPVTRMPVRAPAAPLRRSQQQGQAVQHLIQTAILGRGTRAEADADGAFTLLAALQPARLEAADTTPALIGLVSRLLLVGSELTAAGLAWTLFLLSQYPAILADLGDELSGALRGALPTVADLGRLPLLDRVLHESLRLLPPQSLDLHCCTAPAQLGMYQLPAGAVVVGSPYLAQRQPEVYFAPHKFRPERWLYVEPSPAEFLPFGAGPGSELSTGLALVELKLILAQIVQRYRLALAPGVQVDRAARLTLVPKVGLSMIITRPSQPMIRREAHGTIRDLVALG